jgi:hypothetical protein
MEEKRREGKGVPGDIPIKTCATPPTAPANRSLATDDDEEAAGFSAAFRRARSSSSTMSAMVSGGRVIFFCWKIWTGRGSDRLRGRKEKVGPLVIPGE